MTEGEEEKHKRRKSPAYMYTRSSWLSTTVSTQSGIQVHWITRKHRPLHPEQVFFLHRSAQRREPSEFDKAGPQFCYRSIFDWAVHSPTTKLCLCWDCRRLERDYSPLGTLLRTETGMSLWQNVTKEEKIVQNVAPAEAHPPEKRCWGRVFFQSFLCGAGV